MNSLGNILALTALDRFHATTSWFQDSHATPWTAIVPLILAVVTAIAVLAILARQRSIASRAWQLFHEQAAGMGMTKAEQEVLRYIIKTAGLRKPMMILTTDGVFQQASAAMVAGDGFASLKKETQRELTAIIRSIREKLGPARTASLQQDGFVNRRRFARVRTNQKAMVAGLPFLSDSSKLESLRAVPGTLLEIAGPGFLIQVQGRFSVGEKVVVMVNSHDKEVISGVGKVRRVKADNNGESSIGGELIDLGREELSRMVRETHAAARQGPVGTQRTSAS